MNDPSPEIVYLIPGQGGDPRGALRGLRNAEPWIRSAIDEVCAQVEAVGAAHGLPSIADVLLTEHRSPLGYGVAPLAAYTASVALHRILADADVRPACVIGQSFGELTAMVCAGAYTVAEGATAVCALNEAFRIALGHGGLVLVRASLAETEKILSRLGRPDLVVACVDAPDETIVSGPNDAVDALLALRDDDLPPLDRLAVPYASHHPDLAPVAQKFRTGLELLTQRALRCRVLSPIRRRAYTDSDDLRDALADCVIKPVQLVETFETFETLPPRHRLFIEIGVGASLCRCARVTLPGARTLAPLAKPLGARDALKPLIP